MTEPTPPYITETEIRCNRCHCLIGHKAGDKIEIGNLVTSFILSKCVCGEPFHFRRKTITKTQRRPDTPPIVS